MDFKQNKFEEDKMFQVADPDQTIWTMMKKVSRMENGKPTTNNNGNIIYYLVEIMNKFKKEVAMEKWKTKYDNAYAK